MEPTRISVEEAKRRFDTDGQTVFLDTRSEEAWRKSNVKIPSAIRVPPDAVAQHLSDIPRNRTIITYCTWPNEASSARAAQVLINMGWQDVHPLIGGFEAWQQAGYPVEPKQGIERAAA